MRRWIGLAVWIGVVALCPAVWAAEQPRKLEEIVVQARSTVRAEGNLEHLDIADVAPAPVATVPDALGRIPGIDIQKRSVLTPKSSQVRIRGLDERRSLIMLDGRPLNGTGVMGGQFVDWSALSLGNWEAIEVGKGAFSAKYGNTLGGTINLVPAELTEKPAARIGVGYQRYDTWSLNAAAAGRKEAFGGRIAADWLKTDGHLRNSQAERAALAGEFTWFWGDDGEVTAGVRYTDGDYNMPVANQVGDASFDPDFPECIGSYLIGPGIRFPGGDTQGDGSYYTKQRTELDLAVKKQLAGIDAEFKLYYNHEDRQDTIYSYNQKMVVLERKASPDISWGWVSRFETSLGAHKLGLGMDGNYQGYGGTENTYVRPGYFPRPPINGSDEEDATRWHGAYIDDSWAVFQRLDLYFGLRYEDYHGDQTVDQVTNYGPWATERVQATFDEDAWLPKLGLVYRPVRGLSLFGRFARATRFPDNPVFYWYYGGYRPEVDPASTVVRKELTYEDAMQYEVGASYSAGEDLTVKLSGYRYEVDDYIRWIFGYRPSRVVYNIDEVQFTGVELDVEGRIWGDVWAFANYTWQKTEKRGDVLDASNLLDDSLSELPENKVNAGIQYRRADGLTAKVTVRWVDDREVPRMDGRSSSSPTGTPVGTPVSLKKMDDYLVVDLAARYPLWQKKGEGFLNAGVNNLFDEEYEQEYGFPAMGQSFYIGIEYKY